MQSCSRKAVAVAVAVCALMAGCAGGPDDGDGPDVGEIDASNFVYRGDCAAERPALDTVMVWGKQSSAAGQGEDASRSQVVSTRRVRLGAPAQEYLLVRLQCSIGARTATGWHLLGHDGDRPADLGIVAAAYGPIDIDETDGELVVRHSYRRTGDTGLQDTGRTGYRVAVVGLTPVRLYGDERAEDVPDEVAEWPAGAWRAGIVAVSAEPPGQEPMPYLGVQVDTQTVLTSADLAGDDRVCAPVLVRTHTGQRIDADSTEGWSGQGGSRIRLALPSDAPTSSAVARLAEPLREDLAGLLVTGTGLVPALATATAPAGTAADGGVPVTSAAPADDALGDAGEGTPVAVFRDPGAAAVLVGAWSATGEQVMQPLPDASVPADSSCSPS